MSRTSLANRADLFDYDLTMVLKLKCKINFGLVEMQRHP